MSLLVRELSFQLYSTSRKVYTSISTPTIMYRSLSICLLAASLFLSVSSTPSRDEQTLLTPSGPQVSQSLSWTDCGVYLPYRDRARGAR